MFLGPFGYLGIHCFQNRNKGSNRGKLKLLTEAIKLSENRLQSAAKIASRLDS